MSLAQMKQYNTFGCVRKIKYFNLHLGSSAGLELVSPTYCKTLATAVKSICLNNQPRRNKNSWGVIKLPTNCIALPWPKYAESRAKRGRLKTQW